MKEKVENIREGKEMPSVRTPMVELMSCLNAQGYTDEFMLVNEGLKSIETDMVFQPDDIEIVEFHRFEGISDPDDMAILFIVKTKSGIKGTVVDAFGVYGNSELMEFMNHAKAKSAYANGNGAIRLCVERIG